jgi:hypothetical protein
VRTIFRFLRILAGITLLPAAFFACKTAKVVSDFNVKPMSTERIIKKVENNALDCKSFSVKRIACQYSNGENNASFRVNLKTVKGQSVLVTISKLNISAARVMLTPDSIKYISFIDKNYFLGDYGFLKNLLNADINFADIQAILSNNFFSSGDASGKKELGDYTSFIDSGRYVLQATKNRKSKRIEPNGNSVRGNKSLRLQDDAVILQTIVVRPDNFNIEKIRIEDKTNNHLLEFEFGDYTKFRGKDYPSAINMNFYSGAKDISLKLRLGGFSKEPVDSMTFNIPSKYSPVIIN